jgi:hypothetical protein
VTTTSSDVSSVENTLGTSTGVGAKTVLESEYNLDLTIDDSWKTDSVSKTDVSMMVTFSEGIHESDLNLENHVKVLTFAKAGLKP